MNSMQLMLEDLRKSGLDPADMNTRPVDNAERAMTNVGHSVEGYVIPYFNLHGKGIPFYRARYFDSLPKYKQPKETPSHVYFPPDFLRVSAQHNYILVTEGEKKAALACKMGFPCIALGGVDSWRNRTITLPADTELNQLKKSVQAKLSSGAEATEDINQTLATGMQEFLDYALQCKKQIIIAFDSDQESGIKPSVQRAAATFGFELRFRGIPFSHIRQIVLPALKQDVLHAARIEKVGLDDYLMLGPKGGLEAIIQTCLKKRSAFPRHPSIRDFINKRLQKPNLSRKDTQALSIAILSDLDANGIRLRSNEADQTYYFDFNTRKLLKTTFDKDAVGDSPFGRFLYKRYGLSAADFKLIVWLAAQFAAEDPIESVSPHRVTARLNTNDDCVYYQISDSQFVGISSKGLSVHDNGENGILFEADQVEPVDVERLLAEYQKQDEQFPDALPNNWGSVLSEVRLRDQGRQREITSLLYYISPYMYRWRGMQLPVEMVIGESGSGKSTLCELRLTIITGDTKLRNAPQDIKDWHASIANTGGLHVTDNVQLVDRNLRQRLSDEICRIITEPQPHIEMRKYYTNADLMRIPIRAVFALTAIQQPFQNADLLQRAIILDLDKTTNLGPDNLEIRYDSEWRKNMLEKFGGRAGWLAHQLLAMHRFFIRVEKEWNTKYQAKHRLINFEQSLMLMAKVFGEDDEWIPSYLNSTVEKSLSESDWTFEGISAFCTFMYDHVKPNQIITASMISEWAVSQEDFEKCEMLTSTRRLGRYLQIHKSMITTICGLIDNGTRNNKQIYKLVRPKSK